ncbi:MAG: DUF58 domain-containing protein [Planctomycetota bacterium]|nr:DUF58 domain-containing protein [Planctomycetota bacterium]
MGKTDPIQLGKIWRLAKPTRPASGPAGNQLGKGTGASLEFQDYREYQAGDDLRHVDWRAYARTDQVSVRLYQEEISTTVELILDASLSMDLWSNKANRWRELCCFLHAAATGDYTVRGVLAGEQTFPIPRETFQDPALPGIHLEAKASLADANFGGLLRPGTLRIVISDFLFPHHPSTLVAQLQKGAGKLVLLQVLDAEETQPSPRGHLRLQETESGRHQDLPVDESVIQRYKKRLQRLQNGLAEEARRKNAMWATLSCKSSLMDLAAGPLQQAGLLVPR